MYLEHTYPMEKEYLAIEKWSDGYNGSGIYSLVGRNGKRYIGQARHIQDRLHQHRIILNRIIRDGHICSIEGKKLIDAVGNGERFRAEILKKINTPNIQDELRYWEWYYFKLFGRCEALYNATDPPLPSYNYRGVDFEWYYPSLKGERKVNGTTEIPEK